MREVTVEVSLVDEAMKAGGRAYKWVSPGAAGIPDRLIVIPTPVCPCCGRKATVGAVETKAPKKELRALQERQAEELRALGMPVMWANTPTLARQAVRSLL